MNTHKIYVLLTKFPDRGSKVMGLLTRCYYTHASIGLSEDPNTFYSFVKKGFIVEKLTRYDHSDRPPFPCQLLELPVPEKIYTRVKAELESYLFVRNMLRYSHVGVFFCLMHIPLRIRSFYFCSQFVAHILKRTNAANLSKPASLWLPRDFKNIPNLQLCYQGNLRTLIHRFCIPNPA